MRDRLSLFRREFLVAGGSTGKEAILDNSFNLGHHLQSCIVNSFIIF